MEGLPVLGSQGWAAKCEAGSADQRPEPAKAGPPVTMRLEFKPFVAQPDGCIRAKSASSLLSLVVGEARERERRSKCYLRGWRSPGVWTSLQNKCICHDGGG